MRIKVDLLPLDEMPLDINYNEYINGAIYCTIAKCDKELSTKLHNKSGVKFTFSRLLGKRWEVSGNTIIFKGRVRLFFSTPFENVAHAFVQGLLEKEELKISRKKFEIIGIKVLEEKVKSKMTLRTLSPILVYRKRPDGKKEPLPPHSEAFLEAILNNLRGKCYEIYGYYPKDGYLDINIRAVKKVKIHVKGCDWKSYLMIFDISGSEDLIRVGFQAGFGMKNPFGFGMVGPKDNSSSSQYKQ